MSTRRQVLAGLGALSVLGFDPVARLWVSTAHARHSVDRLPQLDGTLVMDPATLAEYATDVGNIIHRTPFAVLYPASLDDVKAMIRYCAKRGIKVAARGQGHTTFGQSQVAGGLVIDMGSFDEIHTIEPQFADVGAGLTWAELLNASVPLGLTPPALTGYVGLSIGGTLSVGGVSPTNAQGAQVDRVRELEVITGTGDLRRCSMRTHRDLFESVLAGVGQYGVITRAVVDLIPAPAMVRTYFPTYQDNATFFRDLRTLLNRGELNDIYNMWQPNGSGGWNYVVNAAAYFNPDSPPDNAHLLRGLAVDPAAVTFQDMPYIDYVLQVLRGIEFLKQIGLWNGVQHPWFDVFLSDETIEPYVADVLPTITPDDVGQAGFFLMLVLRADQLRRPRLRVPRDTKWVYLFDILGAGPGPGEDPAFVARMLERNRNLFEKARALGGYRYPIGSIEFSRRDWARHYGETVDDVIAAKLKYDPARILAPGLGIF